MKSAKAPKAVAPRWTFRSRLRCSAFGWRGSNLAITRVNEALSEIRAVAKRDAVQAAEGAVLFLEKISPAVRDVDSSSGALGNAVYAAVEALVPIIVEAPATPTVRAKWLDRLFEAIQEDDPPYIESLGDHWGDLCASPEEASRWADDFLPTLRRVAEERKRGVFAWFKGTSICYSALFAAGRHDELLDLLERDRPPIWPYLKWGGRVLASRGRADEAIAYMASRAGINTPLGALARFAEKVLLDAGRRAEAYEKHAIEANPGASRLATFRAIAKKYPEIDADRLLNDLIQSSPGDEGKWFATAKSLGRFELAIDLANRSPCDPKTLIRAARDHLKVQPAFSAEAALAALFWISRGFGYEMTSLDAREAYRYALEAATSIGQPDKVASRVGQMLATEGPSSKWLRESLGWS